ncbi:glycosyltransferase [Microbacterium sp. 1.5R]|uniref:glycosyltransferase n=1 Tax=Microbacterium sp. 1.5R TaxID=1916917 RepID=UPI0011A4BFB5|nr:glycosyltransferase [Microbacterium sp. 1.5R]
MTTPQTLLISFIVDADADGEAVERSIRSCLAQSLAYIEVVSIRIDGADARAHRTPADSRITTVSQDPGTPRARRLQAGVDAARGAYVLVLDPGDTLSTNAATRLHRASEESSADLIGFGVQPAEGRRRSTITPVNGPLLGADVVRALVPRDSRAALHLSGQLFRTDLLRRAYAACDQRPDQVVDEGAVVLLAYAAAASYASVSSVEYRQAPLRREGAVDPRSLEKTLQRISAFRSVQPTMREWARHSADPEPLIDAQRTSYLTVVADALAAFDALPPEAQAQGYEDLRAVVDDLDLVTAAVTFAPETVASLVAHGERLDLGRTPARSVLLTTNVLTTGGVSGVLLTQARLLVASGHRVTIVTHRPGSAEALVPDGATLLQLTGTSRGQRVRQWAQLCRGFDVDVVIDHRILYSRDWPSFALAARSAGAATVGWIHNFAGRPTYNGNDLQTLLHSHLRALAHLVVLSPLDVAFWKLRGIDHVSYLPNPPSPFLLASGDAPGAKDAPRRRRLELIWWGRLEEHTKKVTQLVEMAAALQRLGVDFRLRIVGPDWADMTAERLRALAATRGVAERVELTGPRHGPDLLELIDSSDVFVSTSIIEGYPLTLPEAQSRGLPIVMYDLPWLSLIDDNGGVVTIAQQDPQALADAIAELAADPSRYESMSRSSIAAAALATSHDFAALYEGLLRGDLPPEHSPEPTLEDGREVLDLLVFFAERSTPPPRQTPAGPSSAGGTPPGQRAQARTAGERLERTLTPIGRRVIDAVPWLRPTANRIKRALLRR